MDGLSSSTGAVRVLRVREAATGEGGALVVVVGALPSSAAGAPPLASSSANIWCVWVCVCVVGACVRLPAIKAFAGRRVAAEVRGRIRVDRPSFLARRMAGGSSWNLNLLFRHPQQRGS
jgi:hypothetical protein